MTAPAAEARKPAILTVDDDPAVSRAVARDLRRHYGERYRIVRAESGADALATLKELKLRGDTVAVFVADYRMPQMSGIEFLEKAMEFFPMARRVLLTAYADTHAAIDAINVVDLDHYLLKPWDPPEEKLYPVIDGLLEEWRAVGDRGMPYTKVIGHRYNERSWEVRQFLARNGYSFRAVNSDEPKGSQLLEAAGLDDKRLPVVITEKGETLVEPTDAELATLLGLSTSPQLEMYDLAVIGGGPAGLAAAVYGASEGLKTVLIEKATTGGQAGRSSKIENYLGFENGISGVNLTTTARRQAERFGAEVITTQEAGRLEINGVGAAHSIRLNGDSAIGARAVILATGVDYRQLEITGCRATPEDPNEANFVGRGVFYGASVSDKSECAGEDVYIVGGANSAGQAAMYMSETAKSVTMLIRGPSLEAGMSQYLVDRILKIPEHHGPDLHRGRRHRRRGRPPVRAGAARQAHGRDRDRHLRSDVLLHRRDAPYRLARGSGNSPRRSRLHPVGTRSARQGRLDAGSPATPSGNKRAGCVCCRRCAFGVREAGCGRRRRRVDGSDVGAQVFGGSLIDRA